MFEGAAACMPLCATFLFETNEGNDMTLKARIEADWTKLEGFVKGVEMKFFGGKLHQQATHPLTGETAWVPVADGDQEAKDAEAKAKKEAADKAALEKASAKDLTGKEDPHKVPPGGLHPDAASQAHYPGSQGTNTAGGLLAPGTEQGAATGNGGQPNVVLAESPAPGASPAVLGTGTST